MKAKIFIPVRLFFLSVSLLLILTGIAKLYSATGNARILSLNDPILRVNNRALMILLGTFEMGIAFFVMRRQGREALKALLITWLAGNFMLYRLMIYLTGLTNCPCLGTLTDKLPLSGDAVTNLLSGIVIYLFVGGLLILRSQMGDFRCSGEHDSMDEATRSTVKI